MLSQMVNCKFKRNDLLLLFYFYILFKEIFSSFWITSFRFLLFFSFCDPILWFCCKSLCSKLIFILLFCSLSSCVYFLFLYFILHCFVFFLSSYSSKLSGLIMHCSSTPTIVENLLQLVFYYHGIAFVKLKYVLIFFESK